MPWKPRLKHHYRFPPRFQNKRGSERNKDNLSPAQPHAFTAGTQLRRPLQHQQRLWAVRRLTCQSSVCRQRDAGELKLLGGCTVHALVSVYYLAVEHMGNSSFEGKDLQ